MTVWIFISKVLPYVSECDTRDKELTRGTHHDQLQKNLYLSLKYTVFFEIIIYFITISNLIN